MASHWYLTVFCGAIILRACDAAQEQRSTACGDVNNLYVNLTCSSGQWLHVMSERYSALQPEQDCIDSLNCPHSLHSSGSRLDVSCNGPMSAGGGGVCQEEVKAREVLENCGAGTNKAAVTVRYECLSGTDVVDMCSNFTRTWQRIFEGFDVLAYLATPQFPDTPALRRHCSCQVTGEDLRLWAIEIQLDFPAFLPATNMLTVVAEEKEWQARRTCETCHHFQYVNEALHFPAGDENSTAASVDFRDYNQPGQLAWIEIRNPDEGSGEETAVIIGLIILAIILIAVGVVFGILLWRRYQLANKGGEFQEGGSSAGHTHRGGGAFLSPNYWYNRFRNRQRNRDNHRPLALSGDIPVNNFHNFEGDYSNAALDVSSSRDGGAERNVYDRLGSSSGGQGVYNDSYGSRGHDGAYQTLNNISSNGATETETPGRHSARANPDFQSSDSVGKGPEDPATDRQSSKPKSHDLDHTRASSAGENGDGHDRKQRRKEKFVKHVLAETLEDIKTQREALAASPGLDNGERSGSGKDGDISDHSTSTDQFSSRAQNQSSSQNREKAQYGRDKTYSKSPSTRHGGDAGSSITGEEGTGGGPKDTGGSGHKLMQDIVSTKRDARASVDSAGLPDTSVGAFSEANTVESVV
ncbi:hypothetical protein BaRGS_00015638 [Batillaria attramentaria]|uniref:Uncharacterized protein n=1 Tax=Batillaria attramentaria TaxID=370345 RepID=A0ABD0L131_9CAEN